MNETHFDKLVKQMGTDRATHITSLLRELMPTLIYTRPGQRTLAFIEALERATQRALEARLK